MRLLNVPDGHFHEHLHYCGNCDREQLRNSGWECTVQDITWGPGSTAIKKQKVAHFKAFKQGYSYP